MKVLMILVLCLPITIIQLSGLGGTVGKTVGGIVSNATGNVGDILSGILGGKANGAGGKS